MISGVEYSSSGQETIFFQKITRTMRRHPVLVNGQYTVYFAGRKIPFPSEALFPSLLHQYVGYGTRMIVTRPAFDLETFHKETTTQKEDGMEDDDVEDEFEEDSSTSADEEQRSDEEEVDSDSSSDESDSDDWL